MLPLIDEILGREQGLIGDNRDKILWYTGCAQLMDTPEPVVTVPPDSPLTVEDNRLFKA